MDVHDGNGRMETSAGGEPNTCIVVVDTNQEPCVGMHFESEEAARAFYDEYAKRVGFGTRVLSSRKSERDRSIISRGLGCRGASVNRKQGGQREVCTAMILLKREKSGRWVVRKFVRDHNHPLMVQLRKSRRTLMDELEEAPIESCRASYIYVLSKHLQICHKDSDRIFVGIRAHSSQCVLRFTLC
ncbi:protein FAR1-RELATED SEQUENCE 5-like isoform X2 [Alnus glutinosa]|uniref:protein FAR1-RELATED SEQUENCE 5-like isoform X2 n=1 Tax=Alnus glutinosa TaxID=3517 RepID=UPI002D789D71|nr:protein FAR1-RELATED SEQUENCE 5-like isoform X2 [Alnus glutinosa]